MEFPPPAGYVSHLFLKGPEPTFIVLRHSSARSAAPDQARPAPSHLSHRLLSITLVVGGILRGGVRQKEGPQDSEWSSSARRTWAFWALLVAEAMTAKDEEDLPAYFLKQYRQSLLPLLRKHRLTEEGSLSPFVHLQEKRKEAKQVQKALEEKREAFKEKMADIARRWRELHAKKDQLKSYMEKSMRRLKEDDQLRVQALKKAVREREEKTQKEMELLRAKKKLEALKKEHQKLSSQVQKHSIFKNYLEDVVKISPQFEDIQDVISRYKLLVRTRKDLQQYQEKDREMMEQAKVLLDQYEAEKAAEILQCRNELEQLQRRFVQAQSDVRFWHHPCHGPSVWTISWSPLFMARASE
ncbi:coiled-coil domain-containing protein 42-like [Patagioenas fasciata]|uniref:coiled-coil domain-containing protein 42-like n=1 Tax=Patagioenas fasciata TaxID=372321 RepID=UPI003A99189A